MSRQRNRGSESSRCFVLMHPEDTTLQFCRIKIKTSGKPQPQAAITAVLNLPGLEPANASLVTFLHLSSNILIEFWQTKFFTATTPLHDIFNIPLIPHFLIYPVIFRVLAPTVELLPTVNKLKKMLCDQILQSLENQFPFLEDDEMLEEESVALEDLDIEQSKDDEELENDDDSEEEDDLEDPGVDLPVVEELEDDEDYEEEEL